MYQTIIRSCAAPKSGGGKYRRPVRIILADCTDGIKRCYKHGDPTVFRTWENVDSRYIGPRSAYGQAMAEAEAMRDSLNNAMPELIPTTLECVS